MRLALTVTGLLLCTLRNDRLVTCLRLGREESDVIGAPDDYDRDADNNTDIIKGENNWRAKEIDEEISQSVRVRNLKREDPPWMGHRTVPDQFYDYAGRSSRHLKGIEVGKIARENKKLENIFVGADDGSVTDRSPNGDSIKDSEDGSKFRYYENTSSGDFVSRWRTRKFAAESQPLLGDARDFEQKYHDQAFPGNEFTSMHYPIQQISQPESEIKVEDQLNSSNFSRVIFDREQQRIYDIREEIAKLRSLIEILRDQQYILKTLDDVNNRKYPQTKKGIVTTPNSLKEDQVTEFRSLVENNIEEKFAEKINNLERKLSKLGNFKDEVLKAIQDEKSSRINRESYFDTELNKLKKDFFNTKHLIFKMLKEVLKHIDVHQDIHKTHNVFDNNTNFNAILSELKALEKNITTLMVKEPKMNDLVGGSMKKNLETSVEDPLLLKAKSGSARIDDEDELSDALALLEKEKKLSSDERNIKMKLENLLKELDQSEIDSMDALVNEQEESSDFDEDNPETLSELMNLLNRLRKLLKHHQTKAEPKNKKLRILLRKLLNEPESKTGEENELISNLKELSEEINNLQPKDDIISNEDDKNKQFKSFLEKLVDTNLSKHKLSTTPKPTLTQKQIAALLSQLAKIANKNTHKDNTAETQENIFYSKVPLYGTYKCEKIINNQPTQHIELDPPNNQYIHHLHMPYHQQYGTYNAEYDHEDIHQQNLNQLFRGYPKDKTQSDSYLQTFEDPRYGENIFDASYSPKYPANPQEDYSFAEKRIQNLLAQVNDLKYAINHLNRPEYIQTLEDKVALQNLNWQTDNLQHIIQNLLNGAANPYYQNDAKAYPNQIYSNDNFNQHNVKYIKPPGQNYPEKYLNRNHPQTTNYDSRSHFNLKQHQPSHSPNQNEKSSMFREIQLQNLLGQKDKVEINKKENDFMSRRRRSTNNEDLNALSIFLNHILENITEAEEQTEGRSRKTEDLDDEDEDEDTEPGTEDFTSDIARSPNAGRRPYKNQMSNRHRKKQNIFDKIFDKIINAFMNSLLGATPQFIERFFGLNAFYGNNYVSNYQYGDYNVQLPRYFGIGGYIPLIILKTLYSINSFIYELQKSPFIRNFFIPGGIVLLISGLVVFLIYWLQPSYYGQKPYISYNQHKPQYQDTYQSKPYNYYDNGNYYPVKHNYYFNDNKYKNSKSGIYSDYYYNRYI